MGGSILQAKKLVDIARKKAGHINHDGKSKFTAKLKIGDKVIGEAIYTIIKLNTLTTGNESNLPDFLHTAELGKDGIYKRPALITNAHITDLDLTDLPTNKDGQVLIHFRENFAIGDLSKDGGDDVVITTLYKVSTKDTQDAISDKTGKLELNLGPIEFEKIKGVNSD